MSQMQCYYLPCVPVAQWIERLPSKQRAVGSNPAWDATALKNAFYQLLEPKKTRCLDDFASNRPLHQPYPALSLNHGDFAVMTLNLYYVNYDSKQREIGISMEENQGR